MHRLIFGAATTAVVILLTSGCAKQSDDPSARGRLKTVAVSSVGEVPTEEECWEFAMAIEEALDGLDPKAFSDLIDWEAIAEASTSGIDAQRAVKQEFTQSFVSKGRAGDSGLALALVTGIEEGGSLSTLRVVEGKRHPTVRTRLLTPQGSLTYIDFHLARRSDGSIKAVDIFPYTVGEAVSQTGRNFYLSAVAESERSIIDRLAGKDRAFITHLSTLQQMNADILARRYAEVLTTYRSLPGELQDDRSYLILRIGAAAEVDDAEYAAAMDDYLRLYPDDPNASLLQIDHAFLQGKVDEAIAAVDRLDEVIGGDPYLLVLRSGMFLEQDNLEQARADLEQALDRDPSLIEAYWGLVNLSLIEEDHDETVRLLDTLASNFEVEFVDLAEIPEYAGFVQSPQFAEWKARQPEPSAPETPESADEPSPAVEVSPDF